MLERAQAPYGCWYSAGFSPAFPSAGRFYPRCDPHTSANAICLIYKRIIWHGKVSDSHRGQKTAESSEAKGRKALAESHVRVARGALPAGLFSGAHKASSAAQRGLFERLGVAERDWDPRPDRGSSAAPTKRVPQCSEDCLSDWALPKSLGRAEGDAERRQSGQTLWHLLPDPFPNLRNCYHRPCSHYPQGRTQHAHT